MRAETRASRLYKSIELPLLTVGLQTPPAPSTEEALCVTSITKSILAKVLDIIKLNIFA
ncbi:hypothetical protein [Candidatus Parabeggiatoa sp. HSG14]|uniref:hypothetical protein n=1 Tax=Candidatus Parabeggiatoa sp. HSG14 TaxID=3055593 RepID=UPI0025A79DA2|nr:hypothetical protein [Thiotrichales bacterium HSG14]